MFSFCLNSVFMNRGIFTLSSGLLIHNFWSWLTHKFWNHYFRFMVIKQLDFINFGFRMNFWLTIVKFMSFLSGLCMLWFNLEMRLDLGCEYFLKYLVIFNDQIFLLELLLILSWISREFHVGDSIKFSGFSLSWLNWTWLRDRIA